MSDDELASVVLEGLMNVICFRTFMDMGGGPSRNEEDFATQALAILVNCVNGHWKIPVAHF